MEKRKTLNSSSAAEIPQLTKKISKLEYNLEQTRQNHNKLLDEIKSQKEEINALRRERVIFDNVFKDLEKDLKNKELEYKKTLFEYIQVHNEKDLAEEELNKIRLESEKEMRMFSNNFDKAFKETNTKDMKDIEKTKNLLNLVCIFFINGFEIFLGYFSFKNEKS